MDAKLLGAGDDKGDAAVQDLKIALAEQKFLYKVETDEAKKASIREKVEAAVFEHKLSHVYEHLCSQLGWPLDQAKLDSMKAENKAQLDKLAEKISENEKSTGDEEVRDAMMEQADYLANIGARDEAWAAYAEVDTKKPSTNSKLTIAFNKIRLDILYGEWKSIKQLLSYARQICEKGGDWEKKNRLTVYEAVYCMTHRDFERAAKLLLDSVATFTTYELFDYERCIFSAVVTAVISLPRPQLKKQVVEAAEVLTVIHKLPGVQRLLHALYDCDYKNYFPGFLEVVNVLERDVWLAEHVSYFMREARIVAYKQFLASYKSVTMQAMAQAFGLGIEFLDEEISGFIVTGRLAAKVDKVQNVIATVVHDQRHANYLSLIKQGDLLLNRIQKLSKIVDVE